MKEVIKYKILKEFNLLEHPWIKNSLDKILE